MNVEYNPLNPNTPKARALAEWNVRRPYQEFPARVYKARRSERTGKIMASDPEDAAFTRELYREVRDQRELENALSDGWKRNPAEAIEAEQRAEERRSEAAANRYHQESRMSERAQAEARIKDEQLTDGVSHVPEIPEDRLDKSPKHCSAPKKNGERCGAKVQPGLATCKRHAN